MSQQILADKIASSMRKVEDLTTSIKLSSKLLTYETNTLHELLKEAADTLGITEPKGVTVYSGGQPKVQGD